ncbi:MAG TPA: response regulator, partial [Bacteroidia bacterium]|nr:response regulator [Bacteroidia bacterium]
MSTSDIRIFVVEDDPSIRYGLEEVLRGAGYLVESCADGAEALPRIGEALPDLLLLDVMLPGASGYEIARRLRKADCRIPILMLTAKGQEIDKVVGLKAGADDYVTKPFGINELIARIEALLRRS